MLVLMFTGSSRKVTSMMHRFSSIALDHANKQNNASVKGDGSVVRLTENHIALHDEWYLVQRCLMYLEKLK